MVNQRLNQLDDKLKMQEIVAQKVLAALEMKVDVEHLRREVDLAVI
jgi:hypothetical protein